MTRFLFVFILFLFSLNANAQTIDDALRYSRLDFNGTARSMGAGGTLGALGADFSVASTNPAGLATYRSSDFMFTPSFKFQKTSSLLNGTGNSFVDEKSNKLLLENIGYVMASQPSASSWEAINLAIGINKLADFNQNFYYEGSSQGSIVNRFSEQAAGILPDDLYEFEDGLAFDAGALFGPDQDGNYGSDFQDAPGADVVRRERVERTGSLNELVFSLAGNLKHKLMVGVTFGVPILKYSQTRSYEEENNAGRTIPNFNDLTFTEELSTNGAGFNFKLGAIYRASQAIRIGLAFHAPSRLNLTDTWDNSMNYDYTLLDADGNVIEDSDETREAIGGGPFEYRVKTPGRAIANIGVLIKKRGFISGEVEYVDYRGSSLDLTLNSSDTGTELYERSLNQEIEDTFNSALNVKIGGEFAHEIFRIRAGYGLFGTPYADKSSFNKGYSLGLGVRQEKFYIDLAYKHSEIDENYTPYRLVDATQEQQITTQSSVNKVILTLGFRL